MATWRRPRLFLARARRDHANGAYDFGKLNEALMPGRLKVLLVVHLVLGIAPAAMFLLPGDLRWIPLTWALSSVTLAQLMLLAVWAGLGATTAARRWLAIVAGLLYLAAWPTLVLSLVMTSEESAIATFVLFAAMDAAWLLVATSGFLLVRRRFAELVRVTDGKSLPASRHQFSILQVLIVTSLAAMMLGLARASTRADAEGVWFFAFMSLLAILAYAANLALSVWAALAPGRARWRLMVVFAAALFLGMIVSYAALLRLSQADWWLWLFCTQSLAFALPPVIVVLSLLVVRSAGYRLVSKSVAAQLQQHARGSSQGP
jgi:hypothetical protein